MQSSRCFAAGWLGASGLLLFPPLADDGQVALPLPASGALLENGPVMDTHLTTASGNRGRSSVWSAQHSAGHAGRPPLAPPLVIYEPHHPNSAHVRAEARQKFAGKEGILHAETLNPIPRGLSTAPPFHRGER